jgi:hypothetical protein
MKILLGMVVGVVLAVICCAVVVPLRAAARKTRFMSEVGHPIEKTLEDVQATRASGKPDLAARKMGLLISRWHEYYAGNGEAPEQFMGEIVNLDYRRGEEEVRMHASRMWSAHVVGSRDVFSGESETGIAEFMVEPGSWSNVTRTAAGNWVLFAYFPSPRHWLRLEGSPDAPGAWKINLGSDSGPAPTVGDDSRPQADGASE